MNKEQIDFYTDQLLNGKGFFTLPSVFSQEEIQEANEKINYLIKKEQQKVTHFQGANKDKIHLQKRVWDLLNKGEIFQKMAQNEVVFNIVSNFLGTDFCLGSIAANCILPGGPGQEPHIDYPYWDMYEKKGFPFNINHSYPLNCQVTILLSDFTKENGATGVLPYTQKLCRYPNEKDTKKYYDEAIRMEGKAGDVVIFYGLVWHNAMPNLTKDEIRSAILLQYLPKFVKPMEDIRNTLKKEILDNASPRLKQLAGLNYPYPEIMDMANAENTEGRN